MEWLYAPNGSIMQNALIRLIIGVNKCKGRVLYQNLIITYKWSCVQDLVEKSSKTRDYKIIFDHQIVFPIIYIQDNI